MRWVETDRSDPAAVRLYDGHYSRRVSSIGHPNVAGPYKPLVLLTAELGALWVTVAPRYAKHAWPGAWVNSVFRNVRPKLYLSSDLIREACAATRGRWGEPPAQGLISFIDEAATRARRSKLSAPGKCYLEAGFVHVGMTKGGHGYPSRHVLRLAPADFPPAELPLCATLALPGVA